MSKKISDEMKISLGKRIKELREQLGLTLDCFAKPLTIQGKSVNNYERGKAKASDGVLEQIERHYRLNRNWYETGEGEMLLPKVGEQPPDYQPAQRMVAVTNLIRPASEQGWELLECFDVLCPEQKLALLGVAKAMAVGVSVKSPASEPMESGLLAVNSK
jgi:transcriptional regulator with XRE-family HTH domain